MRLLFEIDTKDYNADGVPFCRNSARCIAVRDGKVAMVYSRKFGYYKFPGGGIEEGESPAEAMAREALEEAGLVVVPQSVKEFGYVHRVQKSDHPGSDYFVQDNFYFLCEVEEEVKSQSLDDYEREEGFTPVWVDPVEAMRVNRALNAEGFDGVMPEREARVLEIMQNERVLNI